MKAKTSVFLFKTIGKKEEVQKEFVDWITSARWISVNLREEEYSAYKIYSMGGVRRLWNRFVLFTKALKNVLLNDFKK